MCFYITLISDSRDDAAVKAALGRIGSAGQLMQNASLARVLKGAERQYLKGGECDCGSVLAFRDLPEADRDLSKIAERKRNSGWSAAKVERWLHDQERAAARPRATDDSFERWAHVLNDLLSVHDASVAGLLIHFYNGSLDDEVFNARRKEVRATDDIVAALRDLHADELLVIRKPPAGSRRTS